MAVKLKDETILNQWSMLIDGAAARGNEGQWEILNTRSSVEPFLTYSDRRDLRERVWRTFASRGDNDNAEPCGEIDVRKTLLRRGRGDGAV